TNVSGSATVVLSAPPTVPGPALTVDVGNQTHAISPYIYGMDAYLLDDTTAKKANLSIDRWGGDSTERYNYKLDVTSSISDWYFENQTGSGGDGLNAVSGVKAFDALVERNAADGIKTLGTVPVLGWVAKDSTSCSFPVSLYPGQQEVDSSRHCGNGVYPNGVGGCTSTGGCDITGNDPTLTSISEPPPVPPAASAVNAAWADATWTGSWVEYLVGKFGPGSANNGTSGVAVYDLDNEPSWWDAGSRDVHPDPFTYDEVTQGGIGTALAIKTVDPTAEVSGPVMDYWWDYFYSKKDVENGWYHSTFCWTPWSNPIDREAHGGVPFIEYYLLQMAAAETTYGVRLLDYVDLHTYLAATYEGNGVAFADAGDTGAQQARLNSTRVFWDPTYTDPNFPQPNYITDPNYTTNCSPPAQPPQLIPMMKSWVAKDYPGTKLAIDEYNWGGMEAINGALAEADILGIFGREGLDLGTMWPTTNPSQQVPGTMAFAMYRNYDGNKSKFGDTALASTSTNSSKADAEGQLAVYGALRSSDKAITVMVINKTYGSLTSTIGLENFTAASGTTAQVYQYTSANLTAISQLAAVSVTPPATGGTTSTIGNYSFPGQSITLFVVPQ
ncbi:MAG: glycoside hydrolase family 44 protein, partial [Terracidiphilus sp.]